MPAVVRRFGAWKCVAQYVDCNDLTLILGVVSKLRPVVSLYGTAVNDCLTLCHAVVRPGIILATAAFADITPQHIALVRCHIDHCDY